MDYYLFIPLLAYGILAATILNVDKALVPKTRMSTSLVFLKVACMVAMIVAGYIWYSAYPNDPNLGGNLPQMIEVRQGFYQCFYSRSVSTSFLPYTCPMNGNFNFFVIGTFVLFIVVGFISYRKPDIYPD